MRKWRLRYESREISVFGGMERKGSENQEEMGEEEEEQKQEKKEAGEVRRRDKSVQKYEKEEEKQEQQREKEEQEEEEEKQGRRSRGREQCPRCVLTAAVWVILLAYANRVITSVSGGPGRS